MVLYQQKLKPVTTYKQQLCKSNSDGEVTAHAWKKRKWDKKLPWESVTRLSPFWFFSRFLTTQFSCLLMLSTQSPIGLARHDKRKKISTTIIVHKILTFVFHMTPPSW